MARSLSRASQVYQPGTYTLSVDSLTNADTSALEWSATVEGWPTELGIKLCTVTLLWNSGGGARWDVYSGRRNRDGTPATVIVERVMVPRVAGPSGAVQKANVADGSMTFEVLVALQTALTIRAVA